MDATQLKSVPLEGSFTANGHTYHISERISVARYKAFQKLQTQFGFGQSFRAQFDAWVEMYNLVNKQKFADAAVLAHNVMSGVVQVDNNKVYALELCALFINREGEDIKVYDEAVMQQKISDWEEEGLDMADFFRLAARSVAGYIAVYQGLSRTISTEEETPTPAT